MIKLTINGTEVEVEAGTTILQACESLGIEIPRFCYHDKLSAPASCRMCLVEVEKMPKPVPSCTQPCAEGMAVYTDSLIVQDARKGVMELLLINHPLDCPVCDQGGECDLQDFSMQYGSDRSRYSDEKRIVADKNLGPLIKTSMTRCIHCTRCIRFLDEIAGEPEMGGFFRGEHLEITNEPDAPLTSELSGNLIDICPVGALTDKPNAFRARSWELLGTDSIDVFDAVGSNIRIDSRDNEVMRIVPRQNDDINERWISDKARFACDGLKYQRLDRPYVRKDGRLQFATWEEAFAAIENRIKQIAPEQIAALAGDMADCESMFALKLLMKAIGSPHIDCRQDGAEYDISSRSAYIMNSGISGIEKADAILLVGTNPRHEAAIVNARIRKRWLKGGARIGLIGAATDLNYPYRHIGDSPSSLRKLLNGDHEFAQILSAAKNPMVIVGASVFTRSDAMDLQIAIRNIADKFNMIRPDWNGLNTLQLAASRVGGLDIGFIPQAYGMNTNAILKSAAEDKLEILYLLGADEIDMSSLGKTFIIYQGHHGDKGAERADVILPGAAYTEKTATYVNTEGCVQSTERAVSPPGEAREDWKIIRALSEAIGKTLPIDTLPELRFTMFTANPTLRKAMAFEDFLQSAKAGELSLKKFIPAINNFYMTDVISRASPTMARCSEEILPFILPPEGE